MQIERRHFAMTGLEVRAKSDTVKSDRAAGYAAVFNSFSYDLGGFREIIAPGAFTRSLSDATKGDLNIFALWSHDNAQPLGSTGSGKLTLSEDERGLAFELDTKRFTPAQLDSLADNELRMSFGFIVQQDEWRKEEDGSIVRTLLDVDLPEISFVISPAYPDTSAAQRSMEAWQSRSADVAAPASEDIITDLSDLQARIGAATARALIASLNARGKL